MTMPVHEKIETIVFSSLGGRGCTSGRFGSLIRWDDGSYIVTTDCGTKARVQTTRTGWEVTAAGFTGEDGDLIEAARLALNP